MFNVQLGGFPVAVHLIPQGMIAFSPTSNFRNCYDDSTPIEVFISQYGVELTDKESRDSEKHSFGMVINYKQFPLLLEWLKSFNLHYNACF